jgi:hypothetical protein
MSALHPRADEGRKWWNLSNVPNAEIEKRMIGFNLKHLDQCDIRKDPLYRRHDDLFAEEQLAHGRFGLVLTHDVIGHRDEVTTATIER